MPIFFFIFLYVLRQRKINKHVLDQLGNSCSQEFCARFFLEIKAFLRGADRLGMANNIFILF